MMAREGFAPLRTWYRVTGELEAGKTPLIVAHGGPGCTHDHVDSFKALAEDGRAVIHYDQLGNGKSTHLPEKGGDFWTVGLFLEELRNLIAHLSLERGYYLLGQSWGGMLGAEFAVQRPKGLRGLVIAGSPASMALWISEANRLRADLPSDVQEVLLRHEAGGTIDSAEYLEASEVFYARHVCRVLPNPPEVELTNRALRSDPTVYRTMNGPTEFHVTGTMKTWSVIDRLLECPHRVIQFEC